MKCIICGKETVFETCEDCQIDGKITISIKEYNQLLDYKIKATVLYDNLFARFNAMKKKRNCQIADLKHRIKELQGNNFTGFADEIKNKLIRLNKNYKA
jgi:hypothetical protein